MALVGLSCLIRLLVCLFLLLNLQIKISIHRVVILMGGGVESQIILEMSLRKAQGCSFLYLLTCHVTHTYSYETALLQTQNIATYKTINEYSKG